LIGHGLQQRVDVACRMVGHAERRARACEQAAARARGSTRPDAPRAPSRSAWRRSRQSMPRAASRLSMPVPLPNKPSPKPIRSSRTPSGRSASTPGVERIVVMESLQPIAGRKFDQGKPVQTLLCGRPGALRRWTVAENVATCAGRVGVDVAM
jgi:hypothetical protein